MDDDEEQEQDLSRRRRRDEDDLEDIQFILYAALAYEEYGLGQFQHGRVRKEVVEWRNNKRSRRRLFHPHQTLEVMQQKYTIPDPRTNLINFGPTFSKYYRITMPRFMRIMEVFGNKDPFWSSFRKDKYGRIGPSTEAKLLLPLRTLAYGTAHHSYCDMFEMSETMARSCIQNFNEGMMKYFGDEYLRLPTAADIKALVKLHKKKHKVPGMLGSIDCMHTYWKNCPVAWQQSFCGKKRGPSIVLEAIADYNLFFWHVSYGYSGAMNDIQIINQSTILKKWTNGDFSQLEREAGVVPFTIPGTDIPFERTYVLADGIYPKMSRILKACKVPITDEQIRFTEWWQESSRKDIERAFGVLQGKWKAVKREIELIDVDKISSMVACCLILHNMGISDRIMGDPKERYVPRLAEEEDEEEAAEEDDEVPPRRRRRLRRDEDTSVITLANFNPNLARTIARRDEWRGLKDESEWLRLQQAMIKYMGNSRRTAHHPEE